MQAADSRWDGPVGREVAPVSARRSDSGAAPYLFPRHPTEADRLDLQHYALREAIGANYLAPIRSPTRILDVGCGTGRWGFEMCAELPAALVVGFDLVRAGTEPPPRYHAVRGNLLQGLPFADGQFDFVHQRLLFLGIPVPVWPAVVAELVRVTRPGGWIELVEPPIGVRRAGPAIERLLALTLASAAARGLDTTGVVSGSLDRWLREAGATDVGRREFPIPIGEWGGRVGLLMAADFRHAFTRLFEVLQAQDVLTAEESGDLLERAQTEYNERRAASDITFAYGRKPA
jgi:SAM-dependent methyltransferase